MNETSMVTVYEMTVARDNRKKIQKSIINKFELPLISFTLNIPGAEKDSEIIREIHQYGLEEIESAFGSNIKHRYINNQKTGPEAYFSIDLEANEIKIKTTYIETENRMGRIFDMDVIKTDLSSISRGDMNLKPRKCFICENNAFVCSRNRTHTIIELKEKIFSLWKE